MLFRYTADLSNIFQDELLQKYGDYGNVCTRCKNSCAVALWCRYAEKWYQEKTQITDGNFKEKALEALLANTLAFNEQVEKCRLVCEAAQEQRPLSEWSSRLKEIQTLKQDLEDMDTGNRSS